MMSEAATAVLDAAKNLSADDRFDVLIGLEDYCHDNGEYEYEVSPEFAAELDRRAEETDRNPGQYVKWADLHARLLATLPHE